MDTVKVALRIRPLLAQELDKGCRSCVEAFPEVQQVKIFKNAFTFNHVFDHNIPQSDVYNVAVKNLVKELFKGYNVTVLAYGQTGSGKTHSMGTNYPGNSDKGIIPRAVDDIFEKISAENEWEFKIKASFLELYNEQLYDLLSEKPRDQSLLDLREDTRGVCIPGITEIDVTTADATLQCLQQGSLRRATGATAMNSQSSRSHAIFTLYLDMSKKYLRNVISALGEGNQSFINYRDSKLTRLLQDSLGGNALTIMIACISPADDNHIETLSTLRYADRARKIKNKPIVNQDPKAAEIARLKKELNELRLEMMVRGSSDSPNIICPPEHAALVMKVKTLSDALSDTLAQNAALSERALMAEKAHDNVKRELSELITDCSDFVESESTTLNEIQLDKFKNLHSKINNLQAEQQKSEMEIIMHERNSGSRTPEGSPMHNKEVAVEDVQLRDQFLMQATQLSSELQELTANLAYKEHMVLNMMSSSSQISGMQVVSEQNLRELEQQIADLQKERDELTNQLKNVQSNTACNKLAEQRRKRLQELEQKMAALTKKVTEQARIIKMKENSDEKIKVLHSEILKMKKTKVRLVNQIKLEGDRYRAWKAERERELSKLKQQERQRQNQIVKMENLHLKQQNVLRRKVEEAAIINKRLKDAMALQKNVQEKRNIHGNPERISQWINQELEIMLSTMAAERTLEQLVDDRATLNYKLQQLQFNLKLMDSKKCADVEGMAALQTEIEELKQNLDLRSAQILDLKQKIEDSDQENKARTRWEAVQSMVDAKCALKCLFEAVANAKRESAQKEILLQEIHDIHKDVVETLKKKELEAARQYKAMQKQEQEYEEKVYLLLRQLQEKESSNSKGNLSLAHIQEDELNKLDELRSEVQLWKQKYEEEINFKDQQVLSSVENKPAVLKFSKKSAPPASAVDKAEYASSQKLVFSSSDESEDDRENDPDWTKTPLYRRLQRMKERATKKPLKRSYDSIQRCNCQANCSRKNCRCKKEETKCSSECGCHVDICINRDEKQNETFDEHLPKKYKLEGSPDLTDTENTTYATANSSIPSVTDAKPADINNTFTLK